MALAIFQLIIIQLVLPMVLVISLWRANLRSKLDWILQSLFTLIFISWLYLSSPWDWFSYYIRYIWPVLAILAIYQSWKKVRDLPLMIKYTKSQKWSLGIHIGLILIFGMYHVSIFSGYKTEDKAVKLEFPLKNGTYYVGQGGNHVQLNYHNAYLEQKYAVDIVRINGFGGRAEGIYPKQLEKYVIYGDKLYSPCAGKVLEVRNHLPDLTPPDTDYENPEGNYVKLYCKEDVNVYIAHMQEGSVTIDQGDTFEKGELIGLVGNSGNTSEPHLHIHAEKEGKGIPIQFNGRFLVRNSIVKESR